MLTHIHIENFTIINRLDLEFTNGFSVLTGETGAGKSIIVDAVMQALGARADLNLIREGQERCDLVLSFALQDAPLAEQWLREHELDNSDGDCLLRRSISRDGRSRSTINGSPCPQQLIRQLADLLISIHGQHQHQALLKPEMQLSQLDAYATHENMLLKVNEHYQAWHSVNQQLQKLKEQAKNSEAQFTLLDYQLTEIRQLDPPENEWQELFQTHKQLHHRQKMMSDLKASLELMSEAEISAQKLIQQAHYHVQEMLHIDPKLNDVQELLNSAQINLQEACGELEDYQQSLDLSPEELARTEQRISSYYDLARKHRVEPEQLYTVQTNLEKEIEDLNNSEQAIAKLEEQLNHHLLHYNKVATQLSSSRHQAAKKLSTAITASMQDLGMAGGGFKIELEAIGHKLSAFGYERAQFMVSTNPGQSYQALQKIVSGGELSRISLALQVLSAEKDQTPSLIFDEVDVGIGGKTAAIVGNLLRQLGENAQVLCVTHLPQVAARGHHHFKVSKQSDKKQTLSQITQLDYQQRTEEIARMMGGTEITQQSLAHAQEMLS